MRISDWSSDVCSSVRPAHTDLIVRLPVKKWIHFIAASVRSGTNGTMIDDIDALKAHLEEYDLATLAALKTEGDELLVAVFKLFNALGLVAAKAEGWINSSGQELKSGASLQVLVLGLMTPMQQSMTGTNRSEEWR